MPALGASMTTLTLVVPGRPMNANDRQHWRAKADATRRTKCAAVGAALEQWGIPTRWPKLVHPVTITVQDQCRTANLRDSANAAPAVKAIVDAFTGTLWPDDGPAHVASITFLPAVKTGTDALVLVIQDSAP